MVGSGAEAKAAPSCRLAATDVPAARAREAGGICALQLSDVEAAALVSYEVSVYLCERNF